MLVYFLLLFLFRLQKSGQFFVLKTLIVEMLMSTFGLASEWFLVDYQTVYTCNKRIVTP